MKRFGVFARRSAEFTSFLLAAIFLALVPVLSIVMPVHAIDDYPWSNAAAVPNTGDWGYTSCPNTDPNCKAVTEVGTDGQSYGVIDPFGYYLRNCTSWVAWRLDQHGISMGGSWGNAYQWRSAAQGKGYVYNTTPAKGAIAYWDITNPRHSIAGHVAYVEDYPSANQVDTSEYNSYTASGQPNPGNYAEHTYDPTQLASVSNDKPDGYIHIEMGSSLAPSGSWQSGTPSDLSLFMPGNLINLNAQGVDNGGAGIQKINITSYTPSPGSGWGVVKTTTYPGGKLTANASAATIMPNAPYILVSFDVYSNNGAYKKAPAGVRKYCNALVTSTCVHVAGEGGTSGSGLGGGTICTTPPETSSSVSGAIPGSHGWWRSPATVTLSAYAPCGGAGPQTYYSVNGGSQNTYTGPINFSQEGIYKVDYYSVDALGNVESGKTTQVDIDWTPPVTSGTATGPRDTNGVFRDNVTIGLNSTDNLSGVDYEQYSLDGGSTWTNVNGPNNSFLLSGNGVSRVQYRSVDIAGNVESPHDSGPIIINKYVMFGNGSGQSVHFLGTTGMTLSGDVFSNGTIYANGNTGSTLGTTATTVGTSNVFDSSNTNTTMPPITTGAAPVPMLAYPLSLYRSLATVVFPSDLVLDSVNSTLNSIVYVNGNVEMDNVGLSGPVSIIATGNIDDYTTNSTFQTNDPHNGVLMYAGQNITVHSTGNTNTGLLYAPTGTVSVHGTGLTLHGSLVGDQVEFNGTTNSNISYSAAFSSGTYPLPLAAMGLVAPASTTVGLPSAPTLSGPTGGATVTVTNPVLSWNTDANTFGYQVQLSTSSSFDSFVTNLSQLSTARRVSNLQSGTTYYWRVRAINQAGMSDWSSAATFTVSVPSNPITNGGFETGDLTGWMRVSTTSISSGAHSGSYAAMLGATTPTNGDSTISQTFTIPSGMSKVSFYYKPVCKGTVSNDWSTATLKDNTAGTTQTILSKTCSNFGIWWNAWASVTVGHNYTLNLTNHDDNALSTPTSTLYDDVVVN